MTVDPAIVVAVLSLVGTLTLGVLAWLRDRHKTELDAEAAAVAQAALHEESSVAIALKLRNEAMEERAAIRKETRTQIDTLRTEIDALRTEVGELKAALIAEQRHSKLQDVALSRIRMERDAWTAWHADELTARWEQHRARSTPPPGPPPPTA